MKYNKTLDDIKKEYNLEFLNFFCTLSGDGCYYCSLNDSTVITHNTAYSDTILVENALDLKYLLHRVAVDGHHIHFLDLDTKYTDLTKLRQDAMILSISGI